MKKMDRNYQANCKKQLKDFLLSELFRKIK